MIRPPPVLDMSGKAEGEWEMLLPCSRRGSHSSLAGIGSLFQCPALNAPLEWTKSHQTQSNKMQRQTPTVGTSAVPTGPYRS